MRTLFPFLVCIFAFLVICGVAGLAVSWTEPRTRNITVPVEYTEKVLVRQVIPGHKTEGVIVGGTGGAILGGVAAAVIGGIGIATGGTAIAVGAGVMALCGGGVGALTGAAVTNSDTVVERWEDRTRTRYEQRQITEQVEQRLMEPDSAYTLLEIGLGGVAIVAIGAAVRSRG